MEREGTEGRYSEERRDFWEPHYFQMVEVDLFMDYYCLQEL